MAGHILRLQRERPAHTAMYLVPEGGRGKRGRPTKAWQSTFKEDLMKEMAVSWHGTRRIAGDRERRRPCHYFGQVVKAAKLQKLNGRKSGRNEEEGRPRKSWVREVRQLMEGAAEDRRVWRTVTADVPPEGQPTCYSPYRRGGDDKTPIHTLPGSS